MRYLFLGITLLIAACSTPEAGPTTSNPPSSTIASTTTATTRPTPTTSTRAPTTTTTESPAAAVVHPPQFTAADWLEQGFGAAAIGPPGVVSVGGVEPYDGRRDNALWHFDGTSWDYTLISEVTTEDEYGSTPLVVDVVYWGGRYLAFLMGDETAPQATASYLASEDGASWTLEHIRPRARAGGSLTGIYPTPESPPWPGPAGIASVTTTADEVVAVGWVVTSEGSTAAMWRSEDGRSWTLTPLSNVSSDREWASRVAVGESGWLVGGNGPYHGTFLLWYSADGERWTEISQAFGDESSWSFAALASGQDGLVVHAANFMEDFTIHVWRSDDGLVWTDLGAIGENLGIDGRRALQGDGTVISQLRRGDDEIIYETSVDGVTWTQHLSVIEQVADDHWSPWYQLSQMGGATAVLRTAGDYDTGTQSTAVWLPAPTMDVVRVEQDDTLNMRAEPMGTVLAEMAPASTDIQTTGASRIAHGSRWVEIIHDGRLGWVNSNYLTEPIDDFAALNPMGLLEEIAVEVLQAGTPFDMYVGPKGLTVCHYDRPKHWPASVDPLDDQTVYVWGCPECSPDPGPDHHATFADWVGEGFLRAWNHPEREITIGGPSSGEVDRFTMLRPGVSNLNYISVYGPGGSDYQDWKTWYFYLEAADDRLRIVAIEANMWIP